MEIRLEWLKAFRAIMQTGTVTGATTIIFRTQPQVSRMIAGLEASLGFHLFKREGRRLIPTAEGLRFYTHIEPLLANFDRLNSIAEDIKEKRGKPLVVAAESFSLHCLVPEAVDTMYRASGTQFAIDLCVREMGLWVSRSNVDLAVVALPFTQTDLEQFSFAQAELVATLPANHPLAGKRLSSSPRSRASPSSPFARPRCCARRLTWRRFDPVGHSGRSWKRRPASPPASWSPEDSVCRSQIRSWPGPSAKRVWSCANCRPRCTSPTAFCSTPPPPVCKSRR